MKYFEFGQQNEKLMVLLHGGGVCYKGALPVAEALERDIRKWQDAGYAFTYKVFANVGHGGLIAEHTGQFIEEVKAAHASSPRKGDRLC